MTDLPKMPAVAAGRTQVFQLWADAMARIDKGETGPEVEELLESVHYGANQLAWGAWNAGPDPTSIACVLSLSPPRPCILNSNAFPSV